MQEQAPNSQEQAELAQLRDLITKYHKALENAVADYEAAGRETRLNPTDRPIDRTDLYMRQVSLNKLLGEVHQAQADFEWIRLLYAWKSHHDLSHPLVQEALIAYLTNPKASPERVSFMEALPSGIRHDALCCKFVENYPESHRDYGATYTRKCDQGATAIFTPAYPHQIPDYEVENSLPHCVVNRFLLDQIASYLPLVDQLKDYNKGGYAQAFYDTRFPFADAQASLSCQASLFSEWRPAKAVALQAHLSNLSGELIIPAPWEFYYDCQRSKDVLKSLSNQRQSPDNLAGLTNQAYAHALWARYAHEHGLIGYDQEITLPAHISGGIELDYHDNPPTHGFAQGSLFETYEALLAWLQIAAPDYPEKKQASLMTAYRGLLTGTICSDELDYVDAAFLAFSELTLFDNWQQYTDSKTFFEGRRRTFVQSDPRLRLAEMALIIARLWLCASTSQKMQYQDQIKQMFAKIEQMMANSAKQNEGQLGVIGMMSERPPQNEMFPIESLEQQILARTQAARCHCLVTVLDLADHVHPRQGKKVVLELADYHGYHVAGYQAKNFRRDNGIFFYSREAEESDEPEELAEVREIKETTIQLPPPKLRAEARGDIAYTGPELHEQLEAYPHLGSDLLTRLAVMLEMLTGEQREAFTELEDLLKFLSNTNLARSLRAASSQELRQIKDDLDHIIPQGFDEVSAIIFLCAMSGFIPKESLLELSYRTILSLVVYQALNLVLSLEQREQQKRRDRGQSTDYVSPILQARDDIASLTRKLQAQHPHIPLALHLDFQKELVLAVEKALQVLSLNKHYDFSLHSLFQVLMWNHQKKGELPSRCATDAEMLLAIVQLLSPHAIAYKLHTLGPENDLPMPKFERALRKSGVGDASHARMTIPAYGISTKEPQALDVFDATIATHQRVPSRDFQIQAGRSRQMQAGFAVHLPHPPRSFLATLDDLRHSNLGAEIALELNDIALAMILSPDEPRILLAFIIDTTMPIDKRYQALEKLLALEPRFLAFNVTTDRNISQLHAQLEAVMTLALSHQQHLVVLFCANILRLHHRTSAQTKVLAEKIAREAINVLALDDRIYQAQTKKYPDLLFPDDNKKILKQRQLHEQEKAKLAKANPPEAAQYKPKTIQANEQALEKDCEAMAAIATNLLQAEQAELAATPKEEQLAGNQVRADIQQRLEERMTTLAPTCTFQTHPGSKYFEQVPLLLAAKYRAKFLTDPQGEALPTDELQKRLYLIAYMAGQAALTFTPEDPALAEFMVKQSIEQLVRDGYQLAFTEEQALAGQIPASLALSVDFAQNLPALMDQALRG